MSTGDSVTVPLSGSLAAFVDAVVARGGYASRAEYIRSLVEQAQEETVDAETERKIVAGLDSPVVRMTPDDWARLRQEVRDRAARRKRA